MSDLSYMRSKSELAATKPCGTRIRYMGGCRCLPCRAANASYAAYRARECRRGRSNRIIDAAEVRDHLVDLASHGIGRRTVSSITGLASSTISNLKSGRSRRIRALHARAILDITPDAVVNAAQIVPARPTLAMIAWMLHEGFTKGQLALRLGCKSPNLQIRGPRITARTAMRVSRLYHQLRLGE
jgi:hypothetical protein